MNFLMMPSFPSVDLEGCALDVETADPCED